jgi:hypothetical protein
MILKIFKGVWFLSVLGVMANLLYVYASLPEQVVVQEEAAGSVFASRELLFYGMTGMLVIVNAMVYVIGILHKDDENFRSWFHGLVICCNIFFVFAMSLVQTYNSGENFNFSRIGFLIYGSVSLVVIWASSWPLYSIFRKIFAKQAL